MNELACAKQQRCPGCPLGDAAYEVGLTRKGLELGAELARYAELAPELRSARAASPTLGYRLRAKLVTHGRALGLFERGTHRVIDVDGCPVLSPALTRATRALRRRLPLPIYGADLRETSEGVLVTLLSESDRSRSVLSEVARALVAEDEALSVAIAVRPPGNVRLIAGEPEVVSGPATARHALREGGPYAYAAHGGFVQAHAGQASYVQGEILRQLRAGSPAGHRPRVLELFAGNGSLALLLAQGGADVTAVEAYEPAIALSTRAAREQGLTLRAVAGDATRFMLESAQGGFDAVIVNPPRRGLDAALREALGRAAPARLAYVSCNPRTLARDAAHLALAGLRLARAEPLDMIPWSDAIEALCWFEPHPPPAPRILYEDARFIAVEKRPFERLDGVHGSSLTARVRALPDASQAAPLERFGVDVSGVCWFARLERDLAQVAREERTLTLAVRGNLRKQGTITRPGQPLGTRYRKLRPLGRHSQVAALVRDRDERALLGDFARIGHPVLGDAQHGDRASNQFVQHRYGLDRAFAHCQECELTLTDGVTLRASAALAPDLAQVSEAATSDQPTRERH